jgi:hypothetical protein
MCDTFGGGIFMHIICDVLRKDPAWAASTQSIFWSVSNLPHHTDYPFRVRWEASKFTIYTSDYLFLENFTTVLH